MRQVASTRDNSKSPRPAAGRRSPVVRRSVERNGVRGVLVRRDDVWSVDNEAELRMLAALDGDSAHDSTGALDQFAALAETINAGLLDVSELRSFNGLLSKLMAAPPAQIESVWWDQELMARTAFACVFMSEPSNGNASQWLAWALSARLGDNLVRSVHPGPGWLTMQSRHARAEGDLRRDTCWVAMLPEVFWVRLRNHHEQWLRDAATASDPRCCPAVLRRLARSDNEVVLDLVASHPNTPHAVMRRMAMHESTPALVRMRVAQNRRLPPRLLRRFTQEGSRHVRVAVAAHPSTPLSVAMTLVDDDEPKVRVQVVRHWQLSPQLLRRLARDVSDEVRIAVATNSNTPVDVLDTLSKDRIAAVRGATAHYGGSVDAFFWLNLLSNLAKDRSAAVRQAAAYPLPDWQPRSALSVGWHGSDPVWDKLARDPSVNVRAACASNPNAPVEVLDLLATDHNAAVRRAVACNGAAPRAILRELAHDQNRWVRLQVASNPSAPTDLLVNMLESATSNTHNARWRIAGNPAASTRLLRSLYECGEPSILDALARNPSTPADLLEKLARSRCCLIREEVARNHAAPPLVLVALAGDPDRHVRAAAALAIHHRGHEQRQAALERPPKRHARIRAALRRPTHTVRNLRRRGGVPRRAVRGRRWRRAVRRRRARRHESAQTDERAASRSGLQRLLPRRLPERRSGWYRCHAWRR